MSIRQDFYDSKAWKQVRRNIWLKQHCLCALCNRPVYVKGITDYIPIDKRLKGIVHHIEHLDNINVLDDNVSLNEDNLIGVCIECHNTIHFNDGMLRDEYVFDENGNIVPNDKNVNLLDKLKSIVVDRKL